jgi:DNA-directed RNA polymerase specialized sigma24 family protein
MDKFKGIQAVTSNITSEAELLQASLAGRKEAFSVIVERYQSLICGIAYSGSGNIAKSEELAQETFIRAWKQLRQLKDLGSFRAWLCTQKKQNRWTPSKNSRQQNRAQVNAP